MYALSNISGAFTSNGASFTESPYELEISCAKARAIFDIARTFFINLANCCYDLKRDLCSAEDKFSLSLALSPDKIGKISDDAVSFACLSLEKLKGVLIPMSSNLNKPSNIQGMLECPFVQKLSDIPTKLIDTAREASNICSQTLGN